MKLFKHIKKLRSNQGLVGLFRCIAVLLLVGCSGFGWTKTADVEVSPGFVRLLPPTLPNTAGYFVLVNGDSEKCIVGFRSPVAERVELHEHLMINGAMRMQHVERLTLAPREKLELEPGGYHLMIMGLKSPLVSEQLVEVTILFSDGTDATFVLPVKRDF